MHTSERYKTDKGGLRKKRKSYTGEFKARVVVESLKGEKSLSDLAMQYNIHPNQIKNWRSIFLKEAHHILEDKRRNRVKK